MTKVVKNSIVAGLPELYLFLGTVIAILNPAIYVPTSDSELSILKGHGVDGVGSGALHFFQYT